MARRLRDRPTGDLLVLMITGTICGVLLVAIVVGAVYAFLNPGADVSGPARLIADIVNTLVGLLAGFLAGTTTVLTIRRSRESSDDPE